MAIIEPILVSRHDAYDHLTHLLVICKGRRGVASNVPAVTSSWVAEVAPVQSPVRKAASETSTSPARYRRQTGWRFGPAGDPEYHRCQSPEAYPTESAHPWHWRAPASAAPCPEHAPRPCSRQTSLP